MSFQFKFSKVEEKPLRTLGKLNKESFIKRLPLTSVKVLLMIIFSMHRKFEKNQEIFRIEKLPLQMMIRTFLCPFRAKLVFLNLFILMHILKPYIEIVVYRILKNDV